MSKWAIVMSSGGGTERVLSEFDTEEEARDIADLYDYHYADENEFDWALSVEDIEGTKLDDKIDTMKFNDWKITGVERTEIGEQTDDELFALSVVRATNGDNEKFFISKAYTDEIIDGPFDTIKDATEKVLDMVSDEESSENETDTSDNEEKFDDSWEDEEDFEMSESIDIDNDKHYDMFGEEIDDTKTPPITGEDNLMASVINALIIDEYEAVKGYNDAIVNAKASGNEKMINTLADIVAEENKHIGQLQEIMKMVSSNIENITVGADEAKEQVDKPVPTVFSNREENNGNDDIFADAMYVDGEINDDF